MKLSIIVPVYNEERTVGEVLDKLLRVALPGIEKEIIVVDDGSTDTTRSVLSNFFLKKGRRSNLIQIEHKKNLGKGAAIQSGLKKAVGSIVLIQDADLEYNPIYIPRLIKPILGGQAQVVYGTRLRAKPVLWGAQKTPFLVHFVGNKFLSWLTSLLYNQSVSDMETGYKAFQRRAIDGIQIQAKSFDFEPEITAKILRKGIRIVEVDIKTKPRSYKEGKKIRAFRDGVIALWTLLKYRFVS